MTLPNLTRRGMIGGIAATTAEELLAELQHELELLGRANPEEVDTALLIHPAPCHRK